jgi:hypothetical protein
MEYRSLTESETRLLASQGCTAADWRTITVTPSCELERIRNVNFIGTVRVGNTTGVRHWAGVDLPCGLYDSTIADCTIGDHVRISGVTGCLGRYEIGDGVLLQDVGTMTCEPGAAFGSGVEVDVWNEAGGRGTLITGRLTAQTAYLQAALRHNHAFSTALRTLLDAEARHARPPIGAVGAGSVITHCTIIQNVTIGPAAVVSGAQSLVNGTVVSAPEHPTIVRDGVQAKNFIFAEGAQITGGAIVENTFVGQGVRMGKQFSAENSLFFANCEAFHGEAVAVFAGPYTVTHHKSTLLIAGMFSFYNAGSGTNQSNHMYKLGPVHQGIFERGSKTGSFSYVLFESRIGAFTVVIGKHMANINTPNLPFSYIYEKGGESFLVPGMNILTIGTVRDAEKWPKRDNRKVRDKRDLITFEVFTPYTVEKMRLGRDELLQLSENTPKEREMILLGGVQISRLLLRKGAKYYAAAITAYLTGAILRRLAEGLKARKSWAEATAALASTGSLARPAEWTDLCGLLVPSERIRSLEADVAGGRISTYDGLLERLERLHAAYADEEWEYVTGTAVRELGLEPARLTREQAIAMVDDWFKAANGILSAIGEDAKKEFGPGSRIGYGIDLPSDAAQADFEAVRGTPATNAVVRKIATDLEALKTEAEAFRTLIRHAT